MRTGKTKAFDPVLVLDDLAILPDHVRTVDHPPRVVRHALQHSAQAIIARTFG
jgi:hypothetical protein